MTHALPVAHHHPRRPVAVRPPRLIVAAVAALLAVPGMAGAQAPTDLPPPASPQALVKGDAVPAEKSPAKALAYSLIPTAAGVGIMLGAGEHDVGVIGGLAGFLVFAGPNFGHIYAGDTATATKQIGIRAAASGAMLAGAVWTLVESCRLGFFGEPSGCDAPPTGAAALMIGGAVVSGASTLYSIYDAPRAARRANSRMRARHLTIAPLPLVGPQGKSGLGMHLTGRF